MFILILPATFEESSGKIGKAREVVGAGGAITGVVVGAGGGIAGAGGAGGGGYSTGEGIAGADGAGEGIAGAYSTGGGAYSTGGGIAGAGNPVGSSEMYNYNYITAFNNII